MNADFLTKQEDAMARAEPRRPLMTPLERVIVVIMAVTLAAGCFVISSRQHTEDGQRPWRSGSLLQPLTQLMSLNFEYPTFRGTEVKRLAAGLGVAGALMAAVIGWYVWTKPRDPEARPKGVRPPRSLRDRFRLFFASAAPTSAAQTALVLFAGWTFLSALWASWPAGAVGEAFRRLIPIVWAIVLGRTLKARGARTAGVLVAGILTLTAVIGIWYYYERNPVQRLKFPIGNPIFLAACLLPGLLLTAAWVAGWLEGLFRKPSPAAGDSSGRTQADRGRDAGVPLWLVIASIVCFALVAWAFKLAGSRGPLIGFGCGVVAVVYLMVPRWGRLIIIGLTVVGLIVGGFFVRNHLEDEGPRWATLRFRTYTWKYAIDRFLVRPVSGTGQGGYVLGAQALSRKDAENDPAAFPGPLLGHAHNEWLETLSDLGAAGLALIATALGITFWAAGLALKKLPGRLDRWCLLGLTGALAAMIVEEVTDSTLRTEVFPLVFYTAVGLIWALSASTEKPATEPTEPGHSPGVRVFGLLLGIAGAMTLAWVSLADWQGARAEFQVGQQLEKQDWAGALAKGIAAQPMRLGIEDRLASTDQTVNAAAVAASFWFAQLRDQVNGIRPGAPVSPLVVQVAAENAARFDDYCKAAFQAGDTVLQHMPGYPNVAGQLAELLLLKTQKEQIEQAFGLRPAAGNYIPKARELLTYEYKRDRLNADAALRLLQLTPPSEPIADRLNLLRTPLRSGPVPEGAPAALADLARDPGFAPLFHDWMELARASMTEKGDSWATADPYAPETLRLGALLGELQRGAVQGPASGPEAIEKARQVVAYAGESENLAGGAATMLLSVRAKFPSAAAFARADQARYRLWAAPYKPEEALAIQRQALSEWPSYGPDHQRRQLQEELSIYLLAAGQEDQARANLQALYPRDTAKAVNARVAALLYTLDNWFISVPPPARPVRFSDLVARYIELEPESPAARLIGAQVALEQHNDAAAMGELEQLLRLSDPTRYVQSVRFLSERFPDDEALAWLTEQVLQGPVVQSRPAGLPEMSTGTPPDGSAGDWSDVTPGR